MGPKTRSAKKREHPGSSEIEEVIRPGSLDYGEHRSKQGSLSSREDKDGSEDARNNNVVLEEDEQSIEGTQSD